MKRSKPEIAPDAAELRRDAIIHSAVHQIRGLLETHFRDIGKAAEESFIGDGDQTEPIAIASVTIKWPVLTQAAKVAVRIGWSVRFKDESSQEVDPMQERLDLGKEGAP
jgi:hypothetical protein